ncbi:hypothetical protein M405DRAFT_32553 [Rhizopogon salebrosus TDB-379]|nr:hypothetical protein M405DRAFT_32553 [Rhizopogon salebrosus TDB-379]
MRRVLGAAIPMDVEWLSLAILSTVMFCSGPLINIFVFDGPSFRVFASLAILRA